MSILTSRLLFVLVVLAKIELRSFYREVNVVFKNLEKIKMQLFERVAIIAREIAGSQARLAEKISINPRTFQGYVQASRQDNLWPLLEGILKAYPQVSREWLYFDEGEMLRGGDSQKPPTPRIDAALLRQVIEMLEEHLQAVKGNLSPSAKATVASQLYELIVEQEEQAREPIQMMRLVMGALAKAANE